MSNIVLFAASSSIGKSVIEMLKERGDNIFITSRDEGVLSEIKNEYGCEGAVLETSDFEGVEACFDNAADALGGDIDGVVNFSGNVLLKAAHFTKQEEYEEVLRANLTSSFAVVRAAGKKMSKGGGSVVLISSAAASRGLPNHEAIAAAKGGVEGLIRSAAATYAEKGLRFNGVAPGLVETKLTQGIVDNEASRQISEAMHALHRVGKTEDIAAAVGFLLDPKNNWITGEVIHVDGGLSNLMPKVKP